MYSIMKNRNNRIAQFVLRATLALSFAIISQLLFSSASAATAKKPNILLIMSDDMGFSDLGCYGSEIQTPNLDSLAANGVRFTQFYNGARCCPTRAALLTGLYAHQAGIGHMTHNSGYDGYRGTLNNKSATIAEVLRTGGYNTYMCGKWHVSQGTAKDGNKANWPVQRGFEKFYGTITGGGSFYDPTTLCRQNTYITPVNDPEYKTDNFYYTDALSDNAVRYLAQHSSESSDKPFFMYLAYTAAHWPMHALEKDIAKYKGKFDQGYAPIRKARFEKMKQLGLISRDSQLSPASDDWSADDNKQWEARCMEVYAAMIDNMDQGIGRIIAQLKKDNQLDSTIIFFLQDNGGCAEDMGRTPKGEPKELKVMGPDDLQPNIWPPMQTRDGRAVRTGVGVMPGPADTYIAYGRGWANVSNTPFREYKHWTQEGGISTPLIVHWPKGIPQKQRGKLQPQPSHLIDIMATCVDVSGATYPKEFNSQTIKPMQGVSLQPALNGKSLKRKEPIFWEHEGNRAVRDGKWKIVAKADQPWELYNMENDRTELNDLAQKNPQKVKELAAAWDAWAARSDVLPLGAWKEDVGRPKNKKADATKAAAK